MRKLILILLAFVITSCSLKNASPDTQIQQAVAATLASMPTYTPYPIATSYPTPTPATLAGLFCEYQFCIGHPNEMAFFDLSAQKNLGSPSNYSQGLLAAFNPNLFIQIIWQTAPNTSDPQFMIDLILEDGVDTPNGTPEVKLIRDMNVIYSPITTTASPVLPYGGAAGWICGDRAFAWKVYAPQADTAQPLFEEGFARFTCNK